MKTLKSLAVALLFLGTTSAFAQPHAAGYVRPHSEISVPAENVAVETGLFTADWNNLAAWECPNWFRDAKFGIWAHWDPQCEAEDGDWYARSMYGTGNQRTTFYNYFGHYPGHDWGYKDFCRYWTVSEWNPEELIKLYASAGAKYFMAMGQHHDNYDCWDSPYQEWNSMNIGPKRDIVGEWAEQCRKYGLRLGVSMHGAHAWTFFEVGRDADTGVTKDEGTGTWWEGYDPQELYAQNHEHSQNWSDWGTIHNQWDWGNGVCPPTTAYMQKFQNRVLQCVNKYNPDILYFDDTVLPFYGASTNTNDQYSLNILKHYYNHSANQHDGQQQVVVCGKKLNDTHKAAMLWDIERGTPDRGQELPWQTCTCLGDWHYSKSRGESNNYKSAETVIRMLVDIVSKNGNLLLSVPVRGNGTIDNNERNIVNGIKAWMDINSESIHGTRPWKIFGEGPAAEATYGMNNQGFNEGQTYTSSDVRYVTKKGKVYATIMAWPAAGDFCFKAFSIASPAYSGTVTDVKLLGYGNVPFKYDGNGLTVTVPSTKPNNIAPVFEVTLGSSDTSAELDMLIDYVLAAKNAARIGPNTGNYTQEAANVLSSAIATAQSAQSGSDTAKEAAIIMLRAAFMDFEENGKVPGGNLSLTGKNITTDKLVEDANFSRNDGGSTRFGRPANWQVENFSIQNPNGTKNGIDNYPGYNCLMMGVWSGEDGTVTGDLTNARIYRRITLPAGNYFFGASYNALYQISNRAYIFAGTSLGNTTDIPSSSLAYYPLSESKVDADYYGIEFTLEKETEICLGWQMDLTCGSGTQEVRIKSIRLISQNEKLDILQTGVAPAEGTFIDLTEEKLVEAAAFSTTKIGSRYGTPANWTVENYNISSGQGARNGIDKYPGYNCLSLGTWGDRNSNSGGAALLANSRIYRLVTLDEGRYYFGARYETHGKIAKTYLFVANQLVETSQIEQNAIACHNIHDGASYGDNDNWLGVYFDITEPTTVYLGWQGDLYTDADQIEFRAKAVKLLRYTGTDMTTSKLVESKDFSTSSMGSRYGTPANWTVENYNITSNQGNRNGIDSNPGYNCLSLGIWNDLGSNASGSDNTVARLYRCVHLDAGEYYFGATYNTVYNFSNAAYFFAATQLETTAKLPTASTTLACRQLNSVPYFNSNTREEMYPLYFTLSEPADVYLGWQVDFTQGATAQEFRASQVKLVSLVQSVLGDINRDGKINIADVTALVNIILGKDNTIPYKYDHVAADISKDNKISITDVTALVNKILGKK